MEKIEVWKPNKAHPAVYANAYVTMLPVAKANGYALSIHGSMQRDLDLVAIPWTKEAVDPEILIDELAKSIGWFKRDDHGNPGNKPHGRLSFNIIDGETYGENTRWVDISVMPKAESQAAICQQLRNGFRRICEMSDVHLGQTFREVAAPYLLIDPSAAEIALRERCWEEGIMEGLCWALAKPEGEAYAPEIVDLLIVNLRQKQKP